MGWFLGAIVAVTGALIVVAVVHDINLPPCLQSHTEHSFYFQQIGSISIPMPYDYEVCDLRAAK